MRILIVTLYTIENEFDDCCRSIQQIDEVAEHVVFRNLPKRDAHDKTYQTFMERAGDFDIFMKVDADMIIEDKTLISGIVREFESDKELDWLSVPVFDHFVGEDLGEANIYRNTVLWAKNTGELFTDRTHLWSSIRKRKIMRTNGRILISHCKNPSNYQAFHFGYHRMAKALQKNEPAAILQKRNWETIRKVQKKYLARGKPQCAWAILGADAALRGVDGDSSVSYSNEALNRKFLSLEEELQDKVALADAVKSTILARLPRCPLCIEYYLWFYFYRIKWKIGCRQEQAAEVQ